MSIFDKDDENKDDITRFQILNKRGSYFVMYKGWAYNLSPSSYTQMSLSPAILGVDSFLKEGSKIKGIDGNLTLASCPDWFLGCDVRIEFQERLLDGWVYSLHAESLNVKNFHRVWICPYLKFFFENPPPKLFLSLE
jgi:hypothetical protein